MEINLDEMLGPYKPYYDGENVSFRHITRNVIQRMELNNDSGNADSVVRLQNTLKRYIGLLDEFPDFRKRQLTEDPFHELKGTSSVEDYINTMYSKLKGKSPE